jgi:hypothetical protein
MCGLEAAIAGTTVPQKKGAGASIQPVQALLLASLPQNSVGRQGRIGIPSDSDPACDKPKMELQHLLAVCMPLINWDIAYLH